MNTINYCRQIPAWELTVSEKRKEAYKILINSVDRTIHCSIEDNLYNYSGQLTHLVPLDKNE